MRCGWTAGVMILVLALVLPGRGEAQQILTQTEALALAFPGATKIERRTAFLDEAQLTQAQRLAGGGIQISRPVQTYYVGMSGSRPMGVAYFDAHRVRTMPEVVMIVVSPSSAVERIEILSFAEPPEYKAPQGWLGQFDAKRLTPDLSLRRQIRNISGATLTSRAITEAVRRTLALHQVIAPLAPQRASGSR